ncbi:MAG: tetratricopeptide repeat protein, partial [Planctomycetota bacterium]
SKGLFNPATTALAWAVMVATCVWAIVAAQKRPLIALAILWFFLHLAVESSILPLELIYEHRLYLPLFGCCLLVSVGIFQLCKLTRGAVVTVMILIGLLGWATHHRNESWRNAIVFWQDNVAKHPGEDRAAFNLAMTHANLQQFEEAQRWLDRVLELNPDSSLAYHRRALTHEILGDESAALADYDAAIQVPPERQRGPFSIRDSFLRRGRVHLRNERFAEANADFSSAIDLMPQQAQGYLDRATVNVYQNRPRAVIADFLKATQVEPQRVEAHDKLAWYLATYPDDRVAMPSLALQHATTACQLSGWKAYSPLGTLAATYARLGDFQQAVHWQQRCIKVAPAERLAAMQGRLRLYEQQRPMLERYGPRR